MTKVDRLVERALGGDDRALKEVMQRICVECDRGSAPWIEPESLRSVYEAVWKGILACAQKKLHHDRALPQGRREEIVGQATGAWIAAASTRSMGWHAHNGASLSQFVEFQAEVFVRDAIDRWRGQ